MLPSPLSLRCYYRIYDGLESGVCVFGSNARGRLERCELWGNANCGVRVFRGGDPLLVACTIRDHIKGRACGVLVENDALGKTPVGADCVFARNAKGDVTREGCPPDAPPPDLVAI